MTGLDSGDGLPLARCSVGGQILGLFSLGEDVPNRVWTESADGSVQCNHLSP